MAQVYDGQCEPTQGAAMMHKTERELELSIIMPCLNEARTVALCVSKAQAYLNRSGLAGEIIVADNGSADGSVDLARAAGARVVRVAQRGYGAALQGGMAAARGRWVVMGDADDSYDFTVLDAFVEKLRGGAQLVMGNRFLGGIAPGAMPFLHRYLGNPVLSWIGRRLFHSPIGDFHCGLRAFDRAAVTGLALQCPGMEFASEMVLRSSLAGLRMAEVPTTLARDGRDRPPHLRSWRDGWRHLRLLLMFSPRWLLLYPGLVLCASGALVSGVLTHGPVALRGVGFDVHTLLYATTVAMLGLQLCVLGVITHTYGVACGVLPCGPIYRRWQRLFTLERGIGVGLLLMSLGVLAGLGSVWQWQQTGLSTLDPVHTMRWAIPASGLVLAGAECAFASFVLSFLVHPQPVMGRATAPAAQGEV